MLWANNKQTSVKSLNKQIHDITKENKQMKVTFLELQTPSTHDNLTFWGIPENSDNPGKSTLWNLWNVTFRNVLTQSDKGPWPIVAKFKHFQ